MSNKKKASPPARKKNSSKGGANKNKKKTVTTGVSIETLAKDLANQTAPKGTPSDAASQGEKNNEAANLK